MSDYSGLGGLVEEIKQASRNIELSDSRMSSRLDGLEKSVNELYLKSGRPGFGGGRDDDIERKDAAEMCCIRHFDHSPKNDGLTTKEYYPSSGEIEQALAARRGFRQLLRTGDLAKLGELERKSLSAFSFGTGFLLPPQRASAVLSCLVDPTDLSGLVDKISISGPSVRFLIDNAKMGLGAWACQSGCFANNPVPDLQAGLGELEIKPETLRFVVCTTQDLVEDASINFESWLFDKIRTGMGAVINEAILIGDGIGKPLGLLHPKSGVPICETSASTPPNQFSWQDLIQLKYQIPMQWQPGSVYLMNQTTFAMLLTMSDAGGRPMWQSLPGEEPGFRLAGSPIFIASQMPDLGPGSTPIMYGNFKKAYTVVWRKAVTIQVDPYSAGFCIIYKAEARCGGATTCPNAVRLLRIR